MESLSAPESIVFVLYVLDLLALNISAFICLFHTLGGSHV